MTHIFNEDAEGTAESLTAAIADAISSALKGFSGDHQLAVTVVLSGQPVFDGKKWHVSVSLQVLDHNLEQDDLYHGEDNEKVKNDLAGDDLAAGFVAATYHRQTFNHGQDEVVHMLEDQLDNKSDVFNENDHITLIASQQTHDAIYKENMAYAPDVPANAPDAPGLGPGSSGNKEVA